MGSNNRRAVITGMAYISPFGTDHEEVFRRLCNKENAVRRIDKNTPARQKLKTSSIFFIL